MHLIVCLDDRNGMAFNHRRLSMDRIVTEDIIRMTAEQTIWITDYSQKLFGHVSGVRVSENPTEQALEGEFVFLETESADLQDIRWETLLVYRWNRNYPADVYLRIGEDWNVAEQVEFAGFSHEKVTRERYVRAGEKVLSEG